MSFISAFMALNTSLSVLTPTVPPPPAPPQQQQQHVLPYPLSPEPFPLPPNLRPPANATEHAPRTEGPDWCPTVPGRRVQCGTRPRPLVHGKPELGTIDVAYALVRRTNESAPATNTVMVNPGGPGGAALDLAQWYDGLLASLRTDHDLLLIDPRGIGRSSPVSCGLGNYLLADRPQQRTMVADCAAALGPRAAGYTSAATADDFNAVRKHLGIAKVVLYGQSYGTYLMPIYAERHPRTVRSIVLSAAYPVTFDPFGAPSARAIGNSLRLVCERSAACDGNTAVEDLRTVNARLRAQPIDTTITVGGHPRTFRLTETFLAQALTFAASSGVGALPDQVLLIGRLPALLHQAARGETTPLKNELTALVQGFADLQHDQSHTITVVCNDYTRPWSVEAPLRKRWQQFDRALAKTAPGAFDTFSAQSFALSAPDGGDLCIEWPEEGTARPYKLTRPLPDVPTLVVSGDLDNNTAAENSRLSAAQFPRAQFLSVPNTGHGAEMDSTGCGAALVSGFIRDGRLGDTSCLAAIPPLKVNPVGPPTQ
ncbi:alpha/beta fold hydrolase [Nonomuraea longicatena]